MRFFCLKLLSFNMIVRLYNENLQIPKEIGRSMVRNYKHNIEEAPPSIPVPQRRSKAQKQYQSSMFGVRTMDEEI